MLSPHSPGLFSSSFLPFSLRGAIIWGTEGNNDMRSRLGKKARVGASGDLGEQFNNRLCTSVSVRSRLPLHRVYLLLLRPQAQQMIVWIWPFFWFWLCSYAPFTVLFVARSSSFRGDRSPVWNFFFLRTFCFRFFFSENQVAGAVPVDCTITVPKGTQRTAGAANYDLLSCTYDPQHTTAHIGLRAANWPFPCVRLCFPTPTGPPTELAHRHVPRTQVLAQHGSVH